MAPATLAVEPGARRPVTDFEKTRGRRGARALRRYAGQRPLAGGPAHYGQ
jgi:hypothetical protein